MRKKSVRDIVVLITIYFQIASLFILPLSNASMLNSNSFELVSQSPKSSIRSSSVNFEINELLQQRTSELLGVSSSAESTLSKVGVKTIFDLGTSNLFATAQSAMEVAIEGNASSRFGLIPGDLFYNTTSYETSDDIPNLTIDNLRILPKGISAEMANNLNIKTIRDLALWPPYLAARRLVGESMGATIDLEEIQTEELRPRMGQYPTERVYYSTLVMLQMLNEPDNQKELTGSISLNPAVNSDNVLTSPAIGALLTFSQSWYSQGITLGHMLHSLSLAPGEATRIAVIDWSRRTSAATSESISEGEQLDSASMHGRALSEVQQAVANDFQAGGSRSTGASISASSSSATAAGTGLLTSLFASGDSSNTSQSAFSLSYAESSSWSIGNRSVLGSLTQNVNDRTEQHSTSVRNRRATAIREVSQSEHEQVSTRVVANYNHMHALTIQYYEVVQIYRTEAKIHRADRCLFIPIDLLDFSDSNGMKTVDRFRSALIRAVLNRRALSLMMDNTSAVAISSVAPIKFSRAVSPGIMLSLEKYAAQPKTYMMVAKPKVYVMKDSFNKIEEQHTAEIKEDSSKETTEKKAMVTEIKTNQALMSKLRLWDSNKVDQVSRIIDRSLIRTNSDALHVPDDTELLSISFDNISIDNIIIDRTGSLAKKAYPVDKDTGMVYLPERTPVIDINTISVKSNNDSAQKGTMSLNCSYMGRRFTLPAIPLDFTGKGTHRVASFQSDEADREKELLQHLRDNREYYSHAVFRSLDSATLTFILSRYKWNGKPLISIVEPRPVTIAGNYLVLRAPIHSTEDSGIRVNNRSESWQEYLKNRGLDLEKSKNQRIIPIPTDGVFAEAVLGRSNSAEKLDITRFWNWQDSPIPLSPPEIAPVQTGTRATAENLTPGQLSSPVLNILNPTTLPAPDSIGSVFGALSSLNFRDQSGLSGTQELASKGMEGTLQAVTQAGQLASENMKIEAQKAVSMGQIAADVAKSAIAAYTGNPAAASGAAKVDGISADGARINHGRSMDNRKVAKSANPSTTTGSGSSPIANNPASRSSSSNVTGGNPGPSGSSKEVEYADKGAFGYSPAAVHEVSAPYTTLASNASAFENLNQSFEVKHDVQLVPQLTGMSCWAAGAAMLVGWRDNISTDPSEIAAGTGYWAQYKNGLAPTDTTMFQTWGLVHETPKTYTPLELKEMIEEHGPLWVASAEPGPHIRVITGISGDGTPDNTILYINDPWQTGMATFVPSNTGSQYTETFRQFEIKQRDLAVSESANGIYIAHLP